MNKNKNTLLTRIMSVLLIAVMLFSSVIGMATGIFAAEKKEKSYDIAVVFDNSGSMYLPYTDGVNQYPNKSWARAKYAMEIFASMLTFNKDKPDKLTVFPMWEVTTENMDVMPIYDDKAEGFINNWDSKENSEPVEVTSVQDIDKIHYMYTIKASGTPFTPVEQAHEYLLKSEAEVKWLVVLTDGSFSDPVEYEDIDKVRSTLQSYTTEGIKVQYLNFSEEGVEKIDMKADKDAGLYTATCDSTNLMSELVSICNRIFERHILPLDDYYKNGKLTLDLSLSKLIVFAQGQGAAINALKSDSGSNINKISDSGQRKFSDVKFGTGREVDGGVVTDDTLYGQVVTFDACPAGTYTLDVTGVDKNALQMFYEPDVDLVVEMFDQDGVKIDGEKDGIRAGDYKIVSKIVDGETGEDVTEHPLLGDSVEIKTHVTDSSDNTYEYENGAIVTFDEDGGTNILVEGTYLKDYKIKSSDYSDFDWMSNIKVAPAADKFVLKFDNVKSRYVLRDHESWKPVKLNVTLEGQKLPDEEIAKIDLQVTVNNKKNDVSVKYEAVPGESAFNLYLAQNSSGEYIAPKEGNYKINVSAQYADPYGETFEEANSAKTRFDKDPWWVDFLKVIVPILVAIAVIVIIACIPVLPKEFYIVNQKNSGDFQTIYSRGGITIGDPKNPAVMILTGTAKVNPKSNNFLISSILKPKGQSFLLTDISAMPKLNYISIKGTTYTNVNGELRSNGKAVNSLTISKGDIEIQVKDRAHFKGRIRINKNQ